MKKNVMEVVIKEMENVKMKKRVEGGRKIGRIEMEELINKLPDWAYEERKKLMEKYGEYEYWIDGSRIDGVVGMLKTDGKYQWCLNYVLYRVCGKNKKTEYRSCLKSAYCMDENGRRGKWRNRKMDLGKVVFIKKGGNFMLSPVVVDEDVLEAFRKKDVSEWVMNLVA